MCGDVNTYWWVFEDREGVIHEKTMDEELEYLEKD